MIIKKPYNMGVGLSIMVAVKKQHTVNGINLMLYITNI